jgi:adenylate cyclase
VSSLTDRLFGQKIQGTRIVPLELKIVVVFTIFILASNLATNYMNLSYNRTELVKFMKQIIVKELKEIYTFANTQHEIYRYEQSDTAAQPSGQVSADPRQSAAKTIREKAFQQLSGDKSISIALNPDGSFFYQAAKESIPEYEAFPDEKSFAEIREIHQNGKEEGALNFTYNDEAYFGIFKYNNQWNIYLIRAEELSEFYSESRIIFRNISIIAINIAFLSAIVGAVLLRFILRFVRRITQSIMEMRESQELKLIDVEKAPNDDITYLGAAFNALSSTINNLLTIFRKFVTTDVAMKAYRENELRLEGSRRTLVILFTDIRGFTYMTETLGNDIIRLLNIHYEKAIHFIHAHDGIIASLIGDALLAVYGTIEGITENQALQALRSAYNVQRVAAQLRERTKERRKQIEAERGALSELEEKVYKAVLLEVGVGIDGGEVFYGNIGSPDRMTNTVIGDNVNSAARLEGLTRFYNVPVICSEYVRSQVQDIDENEEPEFVFVEIDEVYVKGKTIGTKIFWPVRIQEYEGALKDNLGIFTEGLHLYYEGSWNEAHDVLSRCELPVAKTFIERIESTEKIPPEGWHGIWTMSSK